MSEEQLLLKKYQNERCENSFRRLVDMFSGMVQAVAYRRVSGNCHLIDDIVQTVFVDLAINAFKMGPEVKIAGWLHRHTCFVASNSMRSERRRVARERSASEMLNEQSTEPDWALMEPELDSALDSLRVIDREAILLRYFQKLSLKKVGAALGVSDDAAQKRISRAVDQLRKSFAQRGITISAVSLTAVLTKQSLVAAMPAMITTGIAAQALSASGALSIGPAIASTAALTTTIMTKTSIITTIAAAAIGVGGTYLYDQNKLEERDAQLDRLQSQLYDSEQRFSSFLKEREKFVESQALATKGRLDLLRRLQDENTALREFTNNLQSVTKNRPLATNAGLASGSPQQEAEQEAEEQSGYIPRESWVFQGFAEPDAAFKSAVWAMNEGDLDNVSLAWTDEYFASRADEFSNKTDVEISSALKSDIAMVDGIELVGQENVSSVETILQFQVSGTEVGTSVPPWVNARMKLIGEEWRFDGWAEIAQQYQP